MTVDLNVDVGEGFPHDADLIALCSSGNVCCGEHAGSFEVSEWTVAKLRESGRSVGAHPGYPHRESMGRTAIHPAVQIEWLNSIHLQIRRFATGCQPEYVKPHGAFYSDTSPILEEGWRTKILRLPSRPNLDPASAYLAQHPGVQALAMFLKIAKLPLLGMPSTAHEEIASRAGTPFRREGYADRGYGDDGRLIPRGQPCALLTPEEAAEQAFRLAPQVDSICVHGDGERAVETLEAVRRRLEDAGWTISAMV